ncbi:MAG: hypothetical protein WC657_03775 [Candidatus Paceibacterota bacterium]
MSETVKDKFSYFVNFCFEHGNTLRAHKQFGEMSMELDQRITTLEAENAELRERTRWIPVSESPEDDGLLPLATPTTYGSFYDKALIALGLSSSLLPTEETDAKMLKKISDLVWCVKNLSDALRVAYEKIPTHWRTPLPFSYFEIMNKVKKVLND